MLYYNIIFKYVSDTTSIKPRDSYIHTFPCLLLYGVIVP